MTVKKRSKILPSYREPWERQENESSPAFEAFVCYRDLGADRGIRGVAHKIGKNPTLIGKWSSKWAWTTRVAAWDSEYDRRRLEATTGERIKMEVRQIKQAIAFQEVAGAELAALGRRIVQAEKDAAAAGKTVREPVLSPRDIARLAQLGVKIERLSRGVATENLGLVSPEQRQRGLQDLAKSAEARAALKEVIRKQREGK